MSFITNADLISRIGGTQKAAEFTTESGAAPDTAMIDQIIGEVEGLVLAALLTRTSVTITIADHPNTWKMMQGLAMALAMEEVANRRPPVPDGWTSKAERASKVLEQLKDGSLDLPDAVLNTTRTGRGNWRATAEPEAML